VLNADGHAGGGVSTDDEIAKFEFHLLADKNGIATVSYEALRAVLPCAPGCQRAALVTVSRIVLCLRLSTWLGLIGSRRDPRTGFTMAGCYLVRTESLSFVEACLDDEDYLPLFERGLAHSIASVRHLARNILDQAMLQIDSESSRRHVPVMGGTQGYGTRAACTESPGNATGNQAVVDIWIICNRANKPTRFQGCGDGASPTHQGDIAGQGMGHGAA